ncbi:MAG: carboxypeptidase regulatory-like domain-containing protein [Planctomycetota bacterium]|nr:MAG: carboxypeptidase regulatory-like domain-containing protein [Planctomycetota bacterium]
MPSDRLLPAAIILAIATYQHAIGFEITGTIVDEWGRPLPGALVIIRDATVRSAAGPWCNPDCGKHTLSGEDGGFALETVHSLWLFNLHVEADGFLPRLAQADARQRKPVEITMLRVDHPNRRTVGRVLLPSGQPAGGAFVNVVTSQAIARTNGSYAIDRRVQADAAGQFAIHSQQPLTQLDVRVDHPGVQNRELFTLRPGGHVNVVQLHTGATIQGRVLHQARPVPGVDVAMLPLGQDSTWVNQAQAFETTSDEHGHFAFAHVPAEQAYRLFTRMDSLTSRNLASINREIHSPAEGRSKRIGEVNLHAAHSIHGRIVLPDGKGLVPAVRVTLERIRALDAQEVVVDDQGHFEFRGVPRGPVALSIATSGHRLARINGSLDPQFRSALIGRVDEDLSLAVALEHGPPIEHRQGLYFYLGWERRRDLGDQLRLVASPLEGFAPDRAWRADRARE